MARTILGLFIWTTCLLATAFAQQSGVTNVFRDSNGEPKTKLSWSAPTENEDGTPIDYDLAYNLYVDDAETASVSLPGTLNADGKYTAELTDIAALQLIAAGVEFAITLTAFDTDKPERESERSNAVVLLRVLADPKAPTDVSLQE